MEYANTDGALAIFTEGNTLKVNIITTSRKSDAKLQIMNGQQVVAEKVINVAPDSPFYLLRPCLQKSTRQTLLSDYPIMPAWNY